MIPVTQTDVGNTGNCFSACLASLLEIPLEDVPNFYDVVGYDAEHSEWWGAVRDWLRPRGYGLVNVTTTPELIADLEGTFIVGGPGPRGVHHAVLWRDGKVVHDPFPGGLGDVTIDSADLIYPLDPSRFVLK